MKLTDKEQIKVRSKLINLRTSDLVRIVANRHETTDFRDELMRGVRDGGNNDLWCDKWQDVEKLAAAELDKRVPARITQPWENHLPTCGTSYRGCDPTCPKERKEQEGT